MEDQAEQHQKWWQKIQIYPVRTVLIALLSVVVVLIILIILGYIFNWHWTGLVPESSEPKQHAKTLWDWLQLLIIPAVLAVAGYVINLTISRGEQAATEQRAKSEREAAEKRAETEREIALDDQREAALQKYIDNMSELLLKEHLDELSQEVG
jgi:type VI protein secretion system component VasK